MAKKNWGIVRKQKALDTAKYRDVYEDQQLERGNLGEKQTMLGRNILNAIATTLVFVGIWALVTMADMYFSKPEREYNPNPEYLYFHCDEHYVNVNDSSDKITVDEYKLLDLNYDPDLPEIDVPDKKTLGDAYEQAMKDYDAYNARRVDPSEKYKYQIAHYRSVKDASIILPDDYEKLVTEYKTNMDLHKYSEDILGVPIMPLNPAALYKADTYADYKDEKGNPVVLTYRGIYDGSIIAASDYDVKLSLYESDVEEYKEDYLAHRKKYHPDNIDGTAKTMDWSPTWTKFGVSAVCAAIVFGLLYSILKKNLKAQNMLTDTTDINQYKNDQHIALPEEVQRNYDWFPDVGAHSAVQVSSMISHMALLNKGLKHVPLARRAKSDIVNQDGSIEYYKGEILRDADGNALTDSVPIIDEQFMEDLFDASGAPKVNTVRHRYDARRIPYNPDGSNRDKLGKYATVADLINDDWEFPEYEPQRPGGAYIVDTAPVNTMVLAITRAGKGQTVIE